MLHVNAADRTCIDRTIERRLRPPDGPGGSSGENEF
jgi:hypothetical protein